MNWSLYLNIAIAIFGVGSLIAYFLHRSRRKIYFLDGFKIFVGSVFASTLTLFAPVYIGQVTAETEEVAANVVIGAEWKSFFLAIFNTIHLFAVDGEVQTVVDTLKNESGPTAEFYICYTIFMAIVISLLTFGFILSFFKNLTAYLRLILSANKDVYVFSELNRKSVTLAEDLLRNDRRRVIVFTDYFESNDEESYELTQHAKDMGAICFKKDIHALNFNWHNSRKELYFFVIGQDETENVEQSLYLIRKYRDVKNSNLYTFSTKVESELLLTSVTKGNMKVRRVNEVRSLINRILYEEGVVLFWGAYPLMKNKKKIHAVIVGLGEHGSEMLKGLSWYCQMDGYELEIDAFDKDIAACERLYTQCPELLSKKHNGTHIEGDAQYKINLHTGVDADSRQFVKEIRKIEHPTYVFVGLGTDAENVRIAAYLRMLFERNGVNPLIQAVVYNSNEAIALSGTTNYKNQNYRIECIGDLQTSYSEAVILDSELEKKALEIHMKYANGNPDSEEDFWKYEYNYRSSIATAIHGNARKWCNIPGVGKDEKLLTKEEKTSVESLEHRRWNAYMRSEGYCYSGSTNPASRNDLAKLHHDLVPYKALPAEEKAKDRRVSTK